MKLWMCSLFLAIGRLVRASDDTRHNVPCEKIGYDSAEAWILVLAFTDWQTLFSMARTCRFFAYDFCACYAPSVLLRALSFFELLHPSRIASGVAEKEQALRKTYWLLRRLLFPTTFRATGIVGQLARSAPRAARITARHFFSSGFTPFAAKEAPRTAVLFARGDPAKVLEIILGCLDLASEEERLRCLRSYSAEASRGNDNCPVKPMVSETYWAGNNYRYYGRV